MIQCPALKLHCRTPVIISSMNRPGDRYWHSNQGARCKVLDWLTRRNDKDEHAYTPKQIADAIGASHDAIRQLLPRRVAAGEIRRSWSGAYTCRRSGEDDRYRVEHTIRQCLENLERESLDPPMLAKAALE